jgi:hypothetical protein
MSVMSVIFPTALKMVHALRFNTVGETTDITDWTD